MGWAMRVDSSDRAEAGEQSAQGRGDSSPRGGRGGTSQRSGGEARGRGGASQRPGSDDRGRSAGRGGEGESRARGGSAQRMDTGDRGRSGAPRGESRGGFGSAQRWIQAIVEDRAHRAGNPAAASVWHSARNPASAEDLRAAEKQLIASGRARRARVRANARALRNSRIRAGLSTAPHSVPIRAADARASVHPQAEAGPHRTAQEAAVQAVAAVSQALADVGRAKQTCN